MSTMDDIRAFMAQQAEAVSPAQAAEALGIDKQKARQAMYQAAQQGAGIVAADDGTYLLIPGWKSSRGHTSDATSPRKQATKKTRKAKTKPSAKAREAAATLPSAKRAAAADVQISRQSLSLLLQSALASDAQITGPLRAALREASIAVAEA